MTGETKRVLRLIEYEGPVAWIESTLSRSIHGTMPVGLGRITGVVLPDIADVDLAERVREVLVKARAEEIVLGA